MLLTILLVFHILVCIGLIFVVLMQRSEGGALGMGGGPSGFMTARGAGDLLTRTTWILFSLFLVLSVALTFLTARASSSGSVADRLKIGPVDASKLAPPAQPQQQQQPGTPGQPAAPGQVPAGGFAPPTGAPQSQFAPPSESVPPAQQAPAKK